MLLLQYISGRPDNLQIAAVHLVLYETLKHYEHKQLLKEKLIKRWPSK